ncbi:MAG: curli production assembly/transport protein CsgE [Pseudomonadaceae bacterium]|nr:curli production assembly/transport protein CsgE [Pseudomonadaceae bacterium]
MKAIGLYLLLALSGITTAQAVEDEMRGFIVDNTISRFGHDFYRYFSDRLRDTSALDFNLVIRERPSARWGSLVWVEHENRTLFRSFLQPNASELKQLAEQAADQVQDSIAKQKIELFLQNSTDMAKDEL